LFSFDVIGLWILCLDDGDFVNPHESLWLGILNKLMRKIIALFLSQNWWLNYFWLILSIDPVEGVWLIVSSLIIFLDEGNIRVMLG